MLKRLGILLGCAAIACASASCRASADDKQTARTEGERWLQFVDGGQYERAWDEASPLLKASVGRDQFARGRKESRDTRGDVVSREYLSSDYLPQNQYSVGVVDTVILSYRTTYQKKAASKEQLAVVRDSDGVWRAFLNLSGMRLD